MGAAGSGVIIREATGSDRLAIFTLLRVAALPLDGVDDAQFFVAERSRAVVACAALEVRGTAALLRSVAVDEAWRGRGIGDAIVHVALDLAVARQLNPVVLLTTTAADWFARFGFVQIERSGVPVALCESAELKGACPASAVIMCWTHDAAGLVAELAPE